VTSLRPTRPLGVAVAAGLGLLAGLGLFGLGYAALPALPTTAPVSLALIAAAELFLAGSVRARLAGRPGTRPVLPEVVARTAVVARASVLVAGAAAGFWLGAVAVVAPKVADLAVARRDTAVAGGALVLSIGLLLAALRLERACRIPGDRR
jgi:hypothetical protein